VATDPVFLAGAAAYVAAVVAVARQRRALVVARVPSDDRNWRPRRTNPIDERQ
jgi:hypothetical protein